MVDRGICPNCKSDRYIWEDSETGELVCRKCGGVLRRVFRLPHNVPGVGNDTNYAPENKGCFGNDMGNPSLGRKALYQVLGKRARENLGIRAITVRSECMQSQENSITQRIKNYLSNWSKDFGWREKELFSNSWGENAKTAGIILTSRNDGQHSKDIAVGIFIINVKKYFGSEMAFKVWKRLKAKQLYIDKARGYIHMDRLFK